MALACRIVVPEYPHHVTQRGNTRATVFFDNEDRQQYLKLLAKYSKAFSLQIWAYCLMDNHVHLLVVPEKEDSLARGIGLTNQVLYPISQSQIEAKWSYLAEPVLFMSG
ncbi:transposase [uncultured Desulfuromonas sp.]|uniref:transposase n=1 Tax=uncultured Desulfuromonas sp. TaxID=181013 RepID=UPI002AAA6672|nr:transposase [uncultured Desulfuromonas sp.]